MSRGLEGKVLWLSWETHEVSVWRFYDNYSRLIWLRFIVFEYFQFFLQKSWWKRRKKFFRKNFRLIPEIHPKLALQPRKGFTAILNCNYLRNRESFHEPSFIFFDIQNSRNLSLFANSIGYHKERVKRNIFVTLISFLFAIWKRLLQKRCRFAQLRRENEDEALSLPSRGFSCNNFRFRCALTLAGDRRGNFGNRRGEICCAEDTGTGFERESAEFGEHRHDERREKLIQTQRTLMKEQEPSTWKRLSHRRRHRYIPFWFRFNLR